jgi:hypothetical protein
MQQHGILQHLNMHAAIPQHLTLKPSTATKDLPTSIAATAEQKTELQTQL